MVIQGPKVGSRRIAEFPFSKYMQLLDNLTPSAFAGLFSGRPTCSLVGSGASLWAPTNLPSGQLLIKNIFQALFYEDDGEPIIPDVESIRPLFTRFPFERTMERCPNQKRLKELLRDLFNVKLQNPIHETLVEALRSGKLESIVTTNYDCCLDNALALAMGYESWSQLDHGIRIVSHDDVRTETAPIYFKIHGTADDQSGESLVFTLKHEAALPPWKRDLLKRLWSNRVLLIIGYSGLDFEICPEIEHLRPFRVIWNFPTCGDVSDTARSVISRTNGVILLGDMRSLLGKLLDRSLICTRESKETSNLFKNSFGPFERKLWAARVLTSLTCAKYALNVCDVLEKETIKTNTEMIESRKVRAAALYYAGSHKRSARMFDETAKVIEQRNLPVSEVRDLYLAACDSWRSYGGFFRARSRLVRVRTMAQRHADVELVASADIKRLALMRQLFKVSRLYKLSVISRLIQDRVKGILVPLAVPLAESGSWSLFYQLRIWADRFEISSDAITVDGRYDPPPPTQGYVQLGDLMGQMIAFRDQLKKNKRGSVNTIPDALSMAQRAEELGITAEAWKLRLLIAKILLKRSLERGSFHNDIREIWGNVNLFRKHFLACEYSTPLRLIVLLIEL